MRTGIGDPRALLAGARSFWRTRELLGVMVWMRRHNERNPVDPVRIANMAGISQVASLPYGERQDAYLLDLRATSHRAP
ncbi:hypothetical protein [Amycolatopsis japonica]